MKCIFTYEHVHNISRLIFYPFKYLKNRLSYSFNSINACIRVYELWYWFCMNFNPIIIIITSLKISVTIYKWSTSMKQTFTDQCSLISSIESQCFHHQKYLSIFIAELFTISVMAYKVYWLFCWNNQWCNIWYWIKIEVT